MTSEWTIKFGAKLLGEFPFQARNRKYERFAPSLHITHLQFPFRPWDGPIGEWKEHFGKGRGQVHSLDGGEPPRSCNEVEVAKMLRHGRDNAFWFSAYDTTNMPQIWRPWVRSMDELPAWLKEIDLTIRDKIRSASGGMPDVVAWNNNDSSKSALFVECKGPKETFREAQEDWLWASVSGGLHESQFAVSVRPF